MVFYEKLWAKTKEEFAEIILNCKSFNSILTYFGETNGGNIRMLRYRVKKEKHDVSHFVIDYTNKRRKTLEEILVVNSTYKGGTNKIKKRILKELNWEHKCSCCKRTECYWIKTGKDAPIPLELDHINGINTDNRLENLRLLCTLCHATTSTYKGGNKKFSNLPKCIDCQKRIKNKNITRCLECHRKFRKSKKILHQCGRFKIDINHFRGHI